MLSSQSLESSGPWIPIARGLLQSVVPRLEVGRQRRHPGRMRSADLAVWLTGWRLPAIIRELAKCGWGTNGIDLGKGGLVAGHACRIGSPGRL
jgi:hypothetical protein